MDKEKWDALKAPFDISEVKVRPGNTYQQGGKTFALALHYVDARAVMDRLDDVVGVGNWQAHSCIVPREYHGLSEVVIQLTLSVLSPEDIGFVRFEVSDYGQGDDAKGAASDALKRAAVHFGIGRYLWNMPDDWRPLKPPQNKYFQDDKPNVEGLKAAAAKQMGKTVAISYAEALDSYGPDLMGAESKQDDKPRPSVGEPAPLPGTEMSPKHKLQVQEHLTKLMDDFEAPDDIRQGVWETIRNGGSTEAAATAGELQLLAWHDAKSAPAPGK